MTFEKAMRLLLKGKRLCVPGWDKDSYIRLADSADAGVGIVTKEGNTYEIYAADYHSNWKVFEDGYKDTLDDVIRSYSMKVINNDSIG